MKRRGNGKIIKCFNCDKELYINPGRLKNKSHTCSKKCAGELSSKLHSKKIKTVCSNIECRKEIFYKKSHFKNIKVPSCSMKCRSVVLSRIYKGENNPRYKKLNKEDRYFWDKFLELKNRASTKKIPFDLDYQYLKYLYTKQAGLCYYSGIPLNKNATLNKGQAGWDALSIDRVDSNGGYTKNNIVLCLNCVNMLKGSFDLKILEKVITGLAITKTIPLKVVKTSTLGDLKKANKHDAGLDLTATSVVYDKEFNVYIYNTDIKVEIPVGYFGMLAQRSSVYKTDLMLANNLGIIDHGYKENIKLIFRPTCNNPKLYKPGDRIGQLIVMPLPQFEPEFVDELDSANDRGGGFGSSGV